MRERVLLSFHFPSAVRGWLERSEGRKLYKLARLNPTLGAVVEIGSYEGRSTICLAQGNVLVSQQKMFAVDKFVGDDQVGENPDMLERFLSNMETFGLRDTAEVIQASRRARRSNSTSRSGCSSSTQATSTKMCRGIFLSWYPHVAKHGIVAFHDVIYFEGVQRVFEEVMQRPDLRYLETVRSLAVFEKLAD